VGQLAMRPVDRSPLLGDRQHGVDLDQHQAMHGVPTRRKVRERAELAATLPPAVHPVVGHLPRLTHPPVREPVSDRVIDSLQHQFLHLAGDPRRNRTRQPQPDFPRTAASSIACAVTAWVN